MKLAAAFTVAFIVFSSLFVCKSSWNDTSKLDKALTYEEKAAFNGGNVNDADLKSGTGGLIKTARDIFKEKLFSACASSFAVLGICALCGAAKGFTQVSGSNIAEKALDLTSALSVSYLILKNGIISQSLVVAERLETFSKILTPAYAAACAVSKHPASAVSCGSAALLFTTVITYITRTFVFPLISFYAVGNILSVLEANQMLSSACGIIKWIIVTFYRVTLIVFTFYITFSGVIASSTDALTVKTARLVISGTVPVLGGIIADASDTLLSGATMLKNSIGIYGFLGVCGICLVPFMSVLVYFLCFKILSFFGGGIGGEGMSKMLNKAASAYALSLSAVSACCAVQFISIVVSSAVSAA